MEKNYNIKMSKSENFFSLNENQMKFMKNVNFFVYL